jgi:hypothetical protein
MAQKAIPTLDLSPSNADLVDQIRDACEKCGFFMIRNHGANQEVIDTAWKVSVGWHDELLCGFGMYYLEARCRYGALNRQLYHEQRMYCRKSGTFSISP